MSLSAVKFRQRNRVVKLSKEPLSEVSSVLEHAPPQDKGRLWRSSLKVLVGVVCLSRDFVASVLYGGSIVRLVGPGERPLEKHQFDQREVRSEWSSRG
jgi:hypothetical protein